MSGGAAQLRSVLLLVRDAAKAMRFYADGLRLPVIQPLSSTTGSAELRLGRQALSLNTHTQSRPACSCSFSAHIHMRAQHSGGTMGIMIQQMDG